MPSGATLTRCGKIRILSIINPSTTSDMIKLPLETDYPTMETSATWRISSGTLGMISVKTNGEITQMQSNGTASNFTTSARYSITWLAK